MNKQEEGMSRTLIWYALQSYERKIRSAAAIKASLSGEGQKLVEEAANLSDLLNNATVYQGIFEDLAQEDLVVLLNRCKKLALCYGLETKEQILAFNPEKNLGLTEIENEVIQENYRPKVYEMPSNLPENFPIAPFALGTEGGNVTSDFGYRDDPVTKQQDSRHGGVDYYLPAGTEVLSVLSGTVKKIGNDNVYGYHIDIDHGNGSLIRYAHLSEIVNISIGENILKGTVIGLSGGIPGTPGAGKSTGPHLHFEQRQNGISLDPYSSIFSNTMFIIKRK